MCDNGIATGNVTLVGRGVAKPWVGRAGVERCGESLKVAVDDKGAFLLLVEIFELDDSGFWHLDSLVQSLLAIGGVGHLEIFTGEPV